MPFDGITVHALVKEMKGQLLETHIDKIYQPESDEIVMNIRSMGKVLHLLLSSNASHARFQLTENKIETPLSPPSFCMLLRKHFTGGRLKSITQFNYDRIVRFSYEVLNELGDTVEKSIYLEVMGKHSNLILVGDNGRVLDSARRVSPSMSSVRLVEPGEVYELPSHNHKLDPETLAQSENKLDGFVSAMGQCDGPLESALYQVFNGLSPFASREILYRARLEGKKLFKELSSEEKNTLCTSFFTFIDLVDEAKGPFLLYRDVNGKILDFSVIPYDSMEGVNAERFDTLSLLLDVFYQQRDTVDKMKQKSLDLRHLVNTNLERARRKLALQSMQLKNTAEREKYRVKGDLITANLYRLKKGMTLVMLPNYYEEGSPETEVMLDVNLTPPQNAQKYYARYNKLKRTEQALKEQLRLSGEEVRYLESIMASIELADCERDIEDIRQELYQTGYVRKKRTKKKNLSKSEPIRFQTSEGVSGMIGKNNVQNDQLTFKIASPRDEWFHVKDMPGSHVILFVSQLQYGKDYTDQSLLEAAAQAAKHSKGAGEGNVAVDHTHRLYVKKPAASKPGFVHYTHQSTIFVPFEMIETM